MPLLMHAAWQEHAAALLREMMLIRLDDDVLALAHHAGASDALSVLFEQIPVPDLGEDPEAIMGAATEPDVSISKPHAKGCTRTSLQAFDLLDDMLEDAVALADLGELLSPPTQPEIRVMRQWICEPVRCPDSTARLAWRGSPPPTPTHRWTAPHRSTGTQPEPRQVPRPRPAHRGRREPDHRGQPVGARGPRPTGTASTSSWGSD